MKTATIKIENRTIKEIPISNINKELIFLLAKENNIRTFHVYINGIKIKPDNFPPKIRTNDIIKIEKYQMFLSKQN